jgi:hypothetical protein
MDATYPGRKYHRGQPRAILFVPDRSSAWCVYATPRRATPCRPGAVDRAQREYRDGSPYRSRVVRPCQRGLVCRPPHEGSRRVAPRRPREVLRLALQSSITVHALRHSARTHDTAAGEFTLASRELDVSLRATVRARPGGGFRRPRPSANSFRANPDCSGGGRSRPTTRSERR